MSYAQERATQAQNDATAPDLPTVRHFAAAARRSGLFVDPEIRLIAVQHVLRTNLSLFEALFSLGLEPRNTYILGKGYSTSQSCLRALQSSGVQAVQDLTPPLPGYYEEAREKELREFWESIKGNAMMERLEKLLVVDVGGRLLSIAEEAAVDCRRPLHMVGVEQTSSGIRRLECRERVFPIINVAEAAAKSIHESPLVAETILERMDNLKPTRWPDLRAGVIGTGDIGRAMIAALLARGMNVLATDVAEVAEPLPGVPQVPLQRLVEQAEIIFGCTGTDVFRFGLPGNHQPGLTLVSCSSEDIEFRSLLRETEASAQRAWPAQDATFLGPSGQVTILSGGYPLNFDTSGISVSEQAIQATTGLMLAGILTAAYLLAHPEESISNSFVKLPSHLQSAILNDWGREWLRTGHVPRFSLGLNAAEYLEARSVGGVLKSQNVFQQTESFMSD